METKLMFNMKSIYFTIFVTLFTLPLKAMTFDHSHQAWTEILNTHVKTFGATTQFNYKKLKTSADLKKLNSYLSSLSAVKRPQFNSWKEKEQISFLINTYNAYTVKLILDNYPVKSIKKIGSFFKNAWKQKFFELFGKKTHLDHVEHGILRKNFKEPRVHFAVNCASIGCPSLRNEAFVSKKLDQQLDEQAKLFLRDESRNYIKNGIIHLSKIFDWFDKDFKQKSGSVEKFVAPYMSDDKALIKKIASGKFKTKFLNYDWNLNETK